MASIEGKYIILFINMYVNAPVLIKHIWSYLCLIITWFNFNQPLLTRSPVAAMTVSALHLLLHYLKATYCKYKSKEIVLSYAISTCFIFILTFKCSYNSCIHNNVTEYDCYVYNIPHSLSWMHEGLLCGSCPVWHRCCSNLSSLCPDFRCWWTWRRRTRWIRMCLHFFHFLGGLSVYSLLMIWLHLPHLNVGI